MRKKTAWFLIIICILLIVALSACTKDTVDDGTADAANKVKVVSIAVDDSSITTGYAGEFDLSLVKLIVGYSDDSFESFNLSIDYVDVADRTKLDKV